MYILANNKYDLLAKAISQMKLLTAIKRLKTKFMLKKQIHMYSYNCSKRKELRNKMKGWWRCNIRNSVFKIYDFTDNTLPVPGLAFAGSPLGEKPNKPPIIWERDLIHSYLDSENLLGKSNYTKIDQNESIILDII